MSTNDNSPHPMDALDWTRIRSRMIAAADAEGLIDVAVERHDSPFGQLILAATTTGLVRVGLPSDGEDALLEELAQRVSPRVLIAPRTTLTDTRHQLEEYFAQRRRSFELALDWRLTKAFRREVLQETARIPYGSTGTYTTVATSAGRPAAVRAAGTALALNPIPIIVPCHRVLRSDGALGNYRGGVDMKARLLALEGAL